MAENTDEDKTLTQMIKGMVGRAMGARTLSIVALAAQAGHDAGEFAGRKAGIVAGRNMVEEARPGLKAAAVRAGQFAGEVAGHDAGLKAGYEAGHQAAMTEITGLNPDKEPGPPARRCVAWEPWEKEQLIRELNHAMAGIALAHERTMDAIWAQAVTVTHREEVDRWRA